MDDWKNYCTLSLVHFMAFPDMQSGEGDFAASIHQVADLDLFNALEVGPVNRESDRIEISKAIKVHDFHLAFGAQPVILGNHLDLNHADAAVRNHALNVLKGHADHAVAMGAEAFVVMSGRDPGQEDRTDAYARLTESLQLLSEYTERKGMYTVLELFDRGVEKRALAGPADEAATLADQIRMEYPGFGLLYDMGHMPLNQETPESALPLLSPHLAEVHLGNCVVTPGHPAYGDKHPRIGYPGGLHDLPELVHFLRQLFNIGFLRDGVEAEDLPWVGFEVKPQAGETSLEVLESTKTIWQAAWNQL